MEEWRPVVGWEGLYEVSNEGRARSVPLPHRHVGRNRGRVLKLCDHGRGYLYAHLVGLRGDGRNRWIKIHTLVLEAFVGPKPLGMECRHIDGNRRNNALSNLEWGTRLENAADQERHGTRQRGTKKSGHKLTEADIPNIRARLAAGESQTAIGESYGVKQASIRNIAIGRNWRHV